MTSNLAETGSSHKRSPPLLVIVGPTAVGKTALSLDLASQIGGEIVSADSRLLYRGMDIGTDKPSYSDRVRIPHHLIDICRPDETITLGQYQRLANAAIREIQGRDRVPILVGGTGQYVRAVVEGWQIPSVPPDYQLREALLRVGQTELARWLSVLDAESAARIDQRNIRRVIRALEVTLVRGVRMSSLRRSSAPDFTIKMIGLTSDRELLYDRVDGRVDAMMKNGLLDEVRSLRNKGYDRHISSMSGLGYRQLLAYLDGECTLDEAIERIKFETHRFIRQQANWFRLDDDTITWIDIISPSWMERAASLIKEWFGSGQDLYEYSG
ncbi:MAG: tRNA (adenosine(37)-N6)-dimethylallyltransferase MiaA [Candidatus Promineifilaceae bacterium]